MVPNKRIFNMLNDGQPGRATLPLFSCALSTDTLFMIAGKTSFVR